MTNRGSQGSSAERWRRRTMGNAADVLSAAHTEDLERVRYCTSTVGKMHLRDISLRYVQPYIYARNDLAVNQPAVAETAAEVGSLMFVIKAFPGRAVIVSLMLHT